MQRGACLQAARPMRRGTHKLAVACGDRVAVHVHGRQHREEFEAVLAVGGADVGGSSPEVLSSAWMRVPSPEVMRRAMRADCNGTLVMSWEQFLSCRDLGEVTTFIDLAQQCTS